MVLVGWRPQPMHMIVLMSLRISCILLSLGVWRSYLLLQGQGLCGGAGSSWLHRMSSSVLDKERGVCVQMKFSEQYDRQHYVVVCPQKNCFLGFRDRLEFPDLHSLLTGWHSGPKMFSPLISILVFAPSHKEILNIIYKLLPP